jgi:hypothetical protein
LKAEATAVFIILLVSAVAVVYLADLPPAKTTVAHSSSTFGGLVGGLQLRVEVNSTTIKVGQGLGITVSLYNTLASNDSKTVSNDWRVSGFPIAMWQPCLFQRSFSEWEKHAQEPVEFIIVRGSFNFPELEALSSNTTVFVGGCASYGPFLQVQQVVFQPRSSDVYLIGCSNGCNNRRGLLPWSPIRLSANFTVNGYWVYPINETEVQDALAPFSCPGSGFTDCRRFMYPEVGPMAHSLFTSGQYTLVVSDEWGQVVIVYFSVVTPS